MQSRKTLKKIKYFSTRPISKVGRAFNFVLGGRGVGKTFNGINDTVDDNLKFIYMRRTQDEVDLIGSDSENVELSPFAKINARSNDPRFGLKPKSLRMSRLNKKIWQISNGDEEPEHVGICLGLSTVASIRGFDADPYETLIFDEFIPEKHVRKIGQGNAEADAFLNAYESINRDREFIGRKAMTCFLFSNSNSLSHPLLEELNLMTVIERMKRRGQHFIDLPSMDATITLYEDKEFKEAKKKTALYRLTKGTQFYKMAIENDFVYDDLSLIESRPLIEYRPLCRFDDFCIYEHKSNGTYYVSPHCIKCEYFSNSDNDVQAFYLSYGRMLYGAYVAGDLVFENYSVKRKVLEVIS